MNLYKEFLSITPKSPIQIVTISVNNGDGTSNCVTLAGQSITVTGEQFIPGTKVFIKNMQIQRQAPDVSIVEVNV